MLKPLGYSRDMEHTNTDHLNTVHGRFIHHMQLATAWRRALGQRDSEAGTLRLMRRTTIQELEDKLRGRGIRIK